MRISFKHFMQLDVAYVVDHIDPTWTGMKCRVFLGILAVAQMKT